VAQPPYGTIEANWKQRIDQPYIYIDLTGSYTGTGRVLAQLAQLAQEMEAQGMQPSGAPFGLFYDDPGKVAVAQLRSRACLPVDRRVAPRAPLKTDILPSKTVAYAFVGGRYSDLPRAYHGLYSFMDGMNWSERGPIREIYLVRPDGTNDADLIAEIQIPVGWSD
jgi:AraC family transcriptional regulator